MAEVELRHIGTYTITAFLRTSPTSDYYLGKNAKKEVLVQRLKTPLPESDDKKVFLTHARQLKKLRDRAIVNLLDALFDEDYAYLFLELHAQQTMLDAIAPGTQLAPDKVKTYLSPIATALHNAHTHAIVHGNLYPGTIFFDPASLSLQIGNFALMPPDSIPLLDDEEQAIPYMAPERLQGKTTSASDQYSLAIMAYEWLCGQRPFPATERALLQQQQQQPIPALRTFNDRISPAVEQVVLRALSVDQYQRFPHIQAFSTAYLRALMGLPFENLDTTSSRLVVPATFPAEATTNDKTLKDIDRLATKRQQQAVVDNEIIIAPPVTGTQSETTIPPAKDDQDTHKQNHRAETKTEQPVPVPHHRLSSRNNTNKRQQVLSATSQAHSEPDPISGDGEQEEQDETQSPDEATFTGTHLQHIVEEDLRQGGVLSQSLHGYEERSAQIEMATLVSQAISERTPAIIEAATGTGKALDVNTPIPTPTGWRRIGDLITGDFVFDEKGHPTRVTTAFDVMYHHKCYEVMFSDGSSLIADAEHEWISYTAADRRRTNQRLTTTYTAKNFVTLDQLTTLDQFITQSREDDVLSVDEAVNLIGGHRWNIYQATRTIEPANAHRRPTRYSRLALLKVIRDRLKKDLTEQRRDGRAYTLVTTEQMAATLTTYSQTRTNHAIPVAGVLELPEADLPIDPYFLGVWLGDGSCRNNQITTADPGIIVEIEKAGYTVRSLKGLYQYAVDDENGKSVSRWQPDMTGRLRKLDLLSNKHIPIFYLRASEQQRRALLAGLLDTDGTVNRCGTAEFTTTSSQLAQDVYELVCSLGFRSSSREGRACFNGKDCGPKWTIAFTTDQQIFRLERKIMTQKARLRNHTPERTRFRYVVAVCEVPSRPVRCIGVDSASHLYLAGKSMIPTHNSLAYLVPIVRSGQVAIVSTANKALQEQLYYKDIPFIKKHIKHFEAALVKGVNNYICLDRLENERIGMQAFAKNRDFQRLYEYINDPDTGLDFTGDFETLGFQLPRDIRTRIATESDQCAWKKCDFFEDCYVREMRERAEQAQIIVVNHTLLLLDAAMDGFLLPERDLIVLDEAHHLEEEATRSFTITIHPNQIQTLLAQHLLKNHSLLSLQDETMRAAQTLWSRLEQTINPGFKGRANLERPFEEGLRLASTLDDLTDSLRKQRPKDLTDKDGQLYDKLVKRAQNLADNVRTVFAVAEPNKYVYYVERVEGSQARGFVFQASAAPLDVTTWLQERLFKKCNVIATSATLATVGSTSSSTPATAKIESKGPNFTYFRRRIGLDPLEYPDVLESILPLTFDYEQNALLYLPRDLPAPTFGPGAEDYMTDIARAMYRLVKLSHGRAFLLFSSKRMLDFAFDLMAPHLAYPLLKQGDMTRMELTRRFREEEGAVLFGLKSFWEGVDIAGDALSLVVIDKLPFDPPDDPVHEARVAQMKAAGENWFGDYVLPQAVLRLKQGIGRLLRTREDRGVMAILDARLHTKGYGRQVLNALPPARRSSNIRDVERFFSTHPISG